MPNILSVAADTNPDDNRSDQPTDAIPQAPPLSPAERERQRIRDEDFATVRLIQKQTGDRAMARKHAAAEIFADAQSRGLSPNAASLLASNATRAA
jgi:hypothetical protein